jgi:sulfite dehydrogenase (quinone) subunit SoeA
MMMYHSSDSQNAWLRQIISQNYLYVATSKAKELGLNDLDWMWVESTHEKIRCQMKTMEGVEPSTVWTWNAIGRWPPHGGSIKVPQRQQRVSCSIGCFPKARERLSNSGPITGQAARYKLRVRSYDAEESGVWPKIEFTGNRAYSQPKALHVMAGFRRM